MLIAFMVLCTLLPGLAALALAMDRHQEHLTRRWRSRFARWMLRGIGTAGLTSSLGCAVVGMGGARGLLFWLGLLTPSALAVIGALACGAVRGRRRT